MDSIRVMLVDDEIMAIEHFRSLVDWEACGFTIAAQAVTAAQALQTAESAELRVVFMDIRMPAMDGLEISRRLLRRNKSLKIVLLTSHRDFEYAKEALQLGVSGYLLKHEMNAAALEQELRRLRDACRDEERTAGLLRRQSWRELLEDGPGRRELSPEMSGLFAVRDAAMLYVSADAPFPVLDLPSASEPALPDWRDGDHPARLPAADPLAYLDTVPIGRDKRVVLLSVPRTIGEYSLWSALHHAAAGLQRHARRGGVTASVLIGRPVGRPDELHGQYARLEELSAYSALAGRERVTAAHAILLPRPDIGAEWQAMRRMIGAYGPNADASAFGRVVRSVFARLNGPARHPALLRQACAALVQQLERLREAAGLPAYADRIAGGELDDALWYTLADIERWFLREAEAAASHSGLSAGYSVKIRRVIRHIRDHYGEELTADGIGSALSLSGDHIRHLFKEEVGRTLADYVTWYRIEQAKRLLRESDDKIYEIAERVGYQTSQYFSRIFKKWTGMTPQDYKESAGVAE